MADQTRKQKRIASDIKKEVATIKSSKSASTSSPAAASTGYKSSSVAGNALVGKRNMGNAKSANGIGGNAKPSKTTKGGSGVKKMIAAKNANYGCGASK